MDKLNRGLMLLLASLLATTGINAAEEAVDSLFLGNSRGNGVSMAGAQVTGGALYYPESYMKLCAGNYIESVWLYVNAPASNVSSLEVFVSQSLDAPYDFSMPGTVEHFGWNEIVFDEPYQLDGSALYVGFEMAGAGVSYANRIMEGDEFSYTDGEWQPYTGNYSLAFYGVVRGDNLPRHNVSVEWTTPFGYATTGEPVTIECSVQNRGVATVQSLTFACQWDGGSVETTVDGLSIPYLGSRQVTLADVAFPSAGDYEVTLSATKVNGEDDLDMDGNVSPSYGIVCLDDYVRRNVLVEFFSTENCSNCPLGHQVMDNVIGGNERAIEVGHHAAFGTDQWTQDESVEYTWFHGGHESAPSVLFDRSNWLERFPELQRYEDVSSPAMGIGNSSAGALQDALATPAFASVNLSVSNDIEGDYRHIEVKVSGESLLPLKDNESRLFLLLTEDSLFTENQAGAYGNFYHRHTLRDCLTAVWGDPVDLEQGFDETYEYDIPAEWDMKRMQVVAFVAHHNPDDYNDSQVYNSAAIDLRDYAPQSAITEATADGNAPSWDGQTLCIPDGWNATGIYTPSGVRVLSARCGNTCISLDGLPDGIYIYVGSCGGKTVTGKLVK